MERTRFNVEVSRLSGDAPYGRTGQDTVEFMFSANPGEPSNRWQRWLRAENCRACHVGIKNDFGRAIRCLS